MNLKIMWCILLVCSFVAAAIGQNLSLGSPCTHQGQPGRCNVIHGCQSAIEDIKHKRPYTTCGYYGEDPLVCCFKTVPTTKRPQKLTTYIPDDQDDTGNRRADECPPVDPELAAKKNGRRAWDQCADYQSNYVNPCRKSVSLFGGLTRVWLCHNNADQLIVGGEDAELHEFPHMALLGFQEYEDIIYECGGSIISDTFILTAGHCIANRNGFKVSHVKVGIQTRTEDATGKIYKVKRILPHPEYHAPIKYHDIALLELEKPISLDEFTVPACLHTGEPVNDERAVITGWGLTKHKGQVSDTLQKVTVQKYDDAHCKKLYAIKSKTKMPDGFRGDIQLCYGDQKNTNDTCSGDSGGPLQVKNTNFKCMYVVIGITSAGVGCGAKHETGIYTRVSYYTKWIESVVWP